MLYFAKTNPNAIVPSKRDEDAGYDLYACFEEDELILEPGSITTIPTGIATAFPKEYVLVVKERSSTGALGMSVRMGVVDSGYRGEILVGINNTSNKRIIFSKKVDQVEKGEVIQYPYKKGIAQALLIAVAPNETKEVTYDELLQMTSERMASMFGESGK